MGRRVGRYPRGRTHGQGSRMSNAGEMVAAPWIASQARQLQTRRGHAWLLQGPSGLGQYELALTLVQGWLCERSSPDGACGHCSSCHAIAVRTHADLTVLMPETDMLALEWPLSSKAQSEIDDKKRKPSREIRVDALRDAIEFSQRTSARGRGKAVLIYPAERMNLVAANALLKTLEEPPGDVKFVLASEAAHLLLPTIRSRCQLHTMVWPEAGQALAWLRTQGLEETQAMAQLRAAGGRPQAALAHAQAGHDALAWAALPRAMSRGDTSALADFTLAQAVDALQKLCHDLLAQACDASPRFFSPDDLSVAPKPSIVALTAWSRTLVQAARTAEHPFNSGLALETLTAQAHSVFHLP